MDITTLTQKELESMTKEQIISAILGERRTCECIEAKNCPSGQLSRVYAIKNGFGVVLNVEKWDWIYEKSGVVEEISKTIYDSKLTIIEATKIVTVNGVLKSVPVATKDIPSIDIKLP